MADALKQSSKRGSGYSLRFAFAYLLVFAVFGGVIALFAVLVSGSKAPPWSSYRPKGSDPYATAQNLADHIAPRYRHQGGLLAAVEAEPLIVGNNAVDGIAFSRGTNSGVGGGFKQFEPAGGTIMYVFCGPKRNCSQSPTDAVETGSLLRRESLELALYTFKYVGADSVVALLPRLKNVGTPAIYLKRSQFADVLSKPLARTLASKPAFTSDTLDITELATVDRLTRNGLFVGQFQQLGNGRAVLVLGKGNR